VTSSRVVYAVAWVAATLVAYGVAVLWVPGADVVGGGVALLAGSVVAGVAGAASHAVLFGGLSRDPENFLRVWGVSIAVKSMILLTAWGAVAVTRVVPSEPFVWALALGVVGQAHLCVACLLAVPARAGDAGPKAGGG